MKTIEVPVSNGILRAYENRSDYPGIWVVFVDKDGVEYDVAIVESDGGDYNPDDIRTYVYGDEGSEDPTHITYVSKAKLSAVTTPSNTNNVSKGVDKCDIIKIERE